MLSRRLVNFATAASLLLFAATIALWTATATTPRRLTLFDGNSAVYAWREGIALRIHTAAGARTWDLPYLGLALFLLVPPGAWAWQHWRRLPRDVRPPASPEANALYEKIRFLLPAPLAVWLMVGFAGIAIDAHRPAVLLFVIPMETALIANIVARHRLKTRLKRLTQGLCPTCGYNLTANTTGICPECGHTFDPITVN